MTNPNPASTGWRKIQDDLSLIREPVLRNIANDAAIEAYLLGVERATGPQAELHEMPATLLSVEQQIRLALVRTILTEVGNVSESEEPEEFALDMKALVDPLATYVATGIVPVAEPAPNLPSDGAIPAA